MTTDLISLIVPTRGRPRELRRFLASIATTADRPEAIEIVLVIDADDEETLAVNHARVAINRVIVAPGQTMGALNSAGYAASRGRYLMLLNDDVIARTPGWDKKVRACFAAFADDILLVHVNDTVFQQQLCTFPIVSRRFCTLAGGICPHDYVRYRIDDHIEDVFNMLGVLGERRTLYLPEVIFEHENYVTNAAGLRQYFSDAEILAGDGPRFDRFSPRRRELALQLRSLIAGDAGASRLAKWRRRLQAITDPFALRVPVRMLVVRDADLASPRALRRRAARRAWLEALARPWRRLHSHLRTQGCRGLLRAAARKLLWTIGIQRRPAAT